ncbi:MAG: PAS domain-containing protein [Proteobacteria bacterium]|nr:PAS domain-containing protein [Pseudomonadota bacterium]
MKYNIEPTNKELVMRESDFIVSKTDAKGRLTYANRIFIEFSKYSEEELLGKQHNIIRHPDMPRGVFKLLWDTLSQGKEIFAYVKNMSKDGSFYWVIANVTPSYDLQGKLIGYYSVRRKPKPESIAIVEELYKSMLVVERSTGSKNAAEASLKLVSDLLVDKGVTYEEFILSI